jgi:hypothetical protein
MGENKKLNTGILKGVGFEIDGWLDQSLEKGWKAGCAPHFSNKTTYLELLKERSQAVDFRGLIRDIDARIRSNFYPPKPKSQSGKNWRFEPRSDIGSENSSPEVRLEREIVSQSKQKGLAWANQSPVASGLLGPATDRRRAVDLVHERKGNAHYELIELKWNGDTPFFAAMEIVCYGLVYLLFRSHREKFTKLEARMLEASVIGLRVLAPSFYYYPCNDREQALQEIQSLIKIQSLISDAIGKIGEEKAQIAMDFRFWEIPHCKNPKDVPDSELKEAAERVLRREFHDLSVARVTRQGD